MTPPNVLTADHIIPRSKGGEDGPLQVLCRRCNARRSDRPGAEVSYQALLPAVGTPT
ncbi:MAG: HNH endonuclease [Acidimicrobiia bacterium]|nr:HNH endonuclease [Acidimicrobiia bacterium]